MHPGPIYPGHSPLPSISSAFSGYRWHPCLTEEGRPAVLQAECVTESLQVAALDCKSPAWEAGALWVYMYELFEVFCRACLQTVLKEVG